MAKSTHNHEETSTVSNDSDTRTITNEDEEEKHFRKVISAFLYYKTLARNRVRRAFYSYNRLSDSHKNLVSNYETHLAQLLKCIDRNDFVIRQILNGCEHLFNNYSIFSNSAETNQMSTEQDSLSPPSGVTSMDMDKVKTTIKQFVRDWTQDGEQERFVCYKPIIDEVKRRFPPTTNEDGPSNHYSPIQILVPGAGLGRLSWEFARLGYACQGNEVSLYMLIASHFVLNKCSQINAHAIYPWILNFCNNITNDDQSRAVQFPDVDTSSLPMDSRFSMSAGDFLQIYNDPNDWDCVTTCFFIDTAHNVIEYVERLWKILKPGGAWINFGPLLYHFEDIPNEMSFEISYADLRTVILSYGFQIETEKLPIRAGYIKNERSMLHYEYDCVFFVAVKPE
ncbi:unnamed protein product [Adineta steineri]|uniref:Carnosine N-methyltransferase n=2 Tax=Adineta steineri TaxID=433720 RepID=A0A818HBD2_9BILA|nr:unnamed protein product [Adineta steineri]